MMVRVLNEKIDRLFILVQGIGLITGEERAVSLVLRRVARDFLG